MKAKFPNIKYYIVIDFLISALCLLGFYNISQKADLPFNIRSENAQLKIEKLNQRSNHLVEGDLLLSIDGFELKSREEIEVYLDSKGIGEIVRLEVSRNNKTQLINFELINFYSLTYKIIALLVGLTFLLIGLFVLIKTNKSNVGQLFHWCMVAISMIILMTWGSFTNPNLTLGILSRAGFHFGYAFIPSLFLYFSLLFPFESKFGYRKFLPFVFGTSSLFALLLTLIFVLYAFNISVYWIQFYLMVFDVCSIFVVLSTLFALFIQYRNYNSTKLLSNRTKLRWILLGYFVGPLSYIFLWVIPQRITTVGLIPEELVLILISFVPITFAIAIVKYKIMDIDLIVRRSIVYPITVFLLILIYVTFYFLLNKILELQNTEIYSIISALFISLLFHPVKEKLKRIVNKKVFKVEYDYRIALRDILIELKEINDVQYLARKIISQIDKIIPVERIGYCAINFPQTDGKLIAHNNLDIYNNNELNIDWELLSTNSPLPYANSSFMEVDTKYLNGDLKIFQDIDINLMYVIKSTSNEIFGLLVLGEKKSKEKFTVEDIDLLNIISLKFGETIERIKLQEDLIKEKIEKERLEELNLLKSYFVSNVSHDLKTPLTSIKMFAELLDSSENISKEKTHQYLKIIEGESNRLTRLVNSILDYSKIERGIKEYQFTKFDAIESFQRVINLMEYQFKMNEFIIIKSIPQKQIHIFADEDSFHEAIINLISNAIKYSPDKKQIEFAIETSDHYLIVEIKDSGCGIPDEDIKQIFNPYFQSSNTKMLNHKGIGLGLTIVKNIIDAHKGKIEVKSSLVNGSTFKLFFPLAKDKYETNINN